MIKFLQPTYYASIVYKTNFRNIAEQNVQRFDFDLPKPKHHDFIYGDIKVVIQSYPIQRRAKF